MAIWLVPFSASRAVGYTSLPVVKSETRLTETEPSEELKEFRSSMLIPPKVSTPSKVPSEVPTLVAVSMMKLPPPPPEWSLVV